MSPAQNIIIDGSRLEAVIKSSPICDPLKRSRFERGLVSKTDASKELIMVTEIMVNSRIAMINAVLNYWIARNIVRKWLTRKTIACCHQPRHRVNLACRDCSCCGWIKNSAQWKTSP